MKKWISTLLFLAAAVTPLSASAVYSGLTQQEADWYYFSWMLLGTALFVLVAVGLFLYWRRLVRRPEIIGEGEALRLRRTVLIIIGAGLAVRLIAAIPSIGYGNDVALFQHWANTAGDGLFNTYNVLGENIDYPPGYVYVLYVFGMLARLLHVQDSMVYDLIIKLPAILCDCGIAFFLYRLCGDRVPRRWTCFFVALWMFNPLSFLDSTVWGQVDAVLTLALLAGLYFITKERFVLSAVVFGGAVMLKPQAIIVLPVLCFALFRHKKVSTFLYSVLAGLGTALGLALPFAVSVDMTQPYMIQNVTPILQALHADGGELLARIVTPFAWILSLFMGTAGHYDYASVNALNFFFGIGANWVKDSESFMGFTYFIWGMIFIVAAAGLTWFLYGKTKKSRALPYMASAVILLLVANFGPRMHERYFFPAVVFLFAAAILKNNKTLLGLAVGTSVFGFFSVLEILVDLNLGIPYMWPGVSVLRLILSWGNVLLALGTAAFAIADSFGKIESTGFDKKIWRMSKNEKTLAE